MSNLMSMDVMQEELYNKYGYTVKRDSKHRTVFDVVTGDGKKVHGVGQFSQRDLAEKCLARLKAIKERASNEKKAKESK